jgi:hypothetical protein
MIGNRQSPPRILTGDIKLKFRACLVDFFADITLGNNRSEFGRPGGAGNDADFLFALGLVGNLLSSTLL